MTKHPLIRMLIPLVITAIIYTTGTTLLPESWHSTFIGFMLGTVIMSPIRDWIYKYGLDGKDN